jgi:hypothetical protein
LEYGGLPRFASEVNGAGVKNGGKPPHSNKYRYYANCLFNPLF